MDEYHLQADAVQSLLELPDVVQNALVFAEILLRVGFQPEAIAFEHVQASSFGLAADRKVLVGVLRDKEFEFSYALGVAIPRVEQFIERGTVLWDADRRAQGIIWEESELTKQEHLLLLLQTVVRQRLRLSSRNGLRRVSHDSCKKPRGAATGPALVPQGARHSELGEVIPAGDATTELGGVDIPANLVCRYIGTGTRTAIQALHSLSVSGDLYGVPLAESEAPIEARTAERVAAMLSLAISDDVAARRHTICAEQVLRALEHSVAGVDLRPLDSEGRRV